MQTLQEQFTQWRGTTMYVIFFTILLIIFVSTIVANIKKEKDDVPAAGKEKIRNYLFGMAGLWGMAAIVLVMCVVGGISLADIGFRQISFNYGSWFTVITLAVSGLFVVYILSITTASLISTKFRQSQIKDSAESVINLLPLTGKEKWSFSGLAFSAGVCEEVLFRGFLTLLIWAIFPSAPVYLVIVVSSVLFGLGHIYQGWQGVLHTGLLGLIFICLYLVTDSLILPMILHFANDLLAAFILKDEDLKQITATLPDGSPKSTLPPERC